ncbi:MAG: TIGR03084 family metal-binding protein [Pseudomonadota bacterium]
MQQASDFLEECQDLETLLRSVPEADFATPTGFKGWTFDDILRHLHVWNCAADLSLTKPETFKGWIGRALKSITSEGFSAFETSEVNGLAGSPLLDTWSSFASAIARRFGEADPAKRVAWAGPDMSVRSSITARQMETWAHGQAIYDALGQTRRNADRIKNLVFLGHNTYRFTFQNRGLPPPEPQPQLVLTAPSGATWALGEEAEGESITGPAAAFCQVATQTRNVADTPLKVTGPNAHRWMEIAQCFAGPPVDPPAPGTRGINKEERVG